MVFLNENSKLKKKIKADAIITNQKKLPIAVLTADCVPVLLYDYEKKIIAAIHAGWKGAYRGIVRNVINFMHKKGCNPKNIIGAIGPSITQKNYEVKADFKKKFIKKHKKNKIFFKNKNELIYFDLPNYVKSQLKSQKIDKIDMIKIDTFDKKNNLTTINPGAAGRHGFHKKRTMIRFKISTEGLSDMEIIELGDRGKLS